MHTVSGRKLGYGELAAAAAALPTPRGRQVQLKEPSAFRYMGKGNVPIVDLFDITTGNAHLRQDVRLPGMKYAVIARPPVVGGKVVSFDASAALKVPGVEKVVKIDAAPPPAKFAPLGGVAVIAKQHLGGAQGPRCAQDRLGRRAEHVATTPRLQGDARGDRAQARQDRAQPGRRRRALRRPPR